MNKCKGAHCTSTDGLGHSSECVKQHEQAYKVVKPCFERATSGSRSFDNCMYFQQCENIIDTCLNNPIIIGE